MLLEEKLVVTKQGTATKDTFFLSDLIFQSFVKWCSHNEIQSNTEVYSSFASIYAEGGTLLYDRLGLN